MAILLYVNGIWNRSAAVNQTLDQLRVRLANAGLPGEQ
jgi:hypothetical protein